MLDPDPDEMNADPRPCLERGVDTAAVVVVEQQVDGVEWVVRLLADLRDVLVQEFWDKNEEINLNNESIFRQFTVPYLYNFN